MPEHPSPLPAAGAHGGDVDAVAASLGIDPADVLDLSASLNPVAPDVPAVVAAAAASVHRYPDDTGATDALAEAIGVPAGRLVLTNGGSEAIALVASLQPSGHVVPPEFSLYERHLATVDPGAPRWRSNPGNPSGRLAPPDDAAGVWDEAFYALATGSWTRGDEGAWRLGSLTKLWACPGLRAGYVIAPSAADADRVRERRPRWSVNTLALATIVELLPRTDLPAWSAAVAALRSELVAELRGRGLPVHDTDACWVLVERPGLRELLAPHGVLVRDCASFGLPGTARIAVPDTPGRRRLLAALDQLEAAAAQP